MRLWYATISWVSRTAFRLGWGVRVCGSHYVPRHGKVVFASNHRSDLDPPLLGGFVKRELHFFAKEELFKGRLFGSLIRSLNAFPVRRGQFDRDSLGICLNVLKNDGALLMFPEGTRAPSDGFLKAKLGVGWVVALSDAPVVPVYVHGTTVTRPWSAKRPGMHIIYGPPIKASDLASPDLRGKDQYQSISDRILEAVRALSLQVPGVGAAGPIYDRDIIDNRRLR